MPRRDASVPRARAGESVSICAPWPALLACLAVLSTAAADESLVSPPPVADGVPLLMPSAPSQPPACSESSSAPNPMLGSSIHVGWKDAAAATRSEQPAAGREATALSFREPPPLETDAGPAVDGSHGVPPAELLHSVGPPARADDDWTWQVMPMGLMYDSYLAGAKEPRFASYWSSDQDLGAIWDTALGGRLGLLRYGTQCAVHPQGWQVDLEGGVQARLDPNADSSPLLAADFRVGVPVTWASGRRQFKTGYYHVSSHLGDEYLLMSPDARRLNYVRDALLLGVGYFWTERLRLYGETAYALSANDGAEPWEFQLGVDWAPAHDTGLLGAPFAAVNGHLREEVDFGGNLVVQAGWAWRRFQRGALLRIGLEYFNGKSDQYEFFDRTEQRFGWGMWADF